MRVEFHGRNVDITPRFRQHAEPRIASLDTFFDRITDVRITLSAQRAWKTVEITLDADGLLLRSEERTNDDLASFDKALDRLERQLRRYRDRMTEHTRRSVRKPPEEAAAAEPAGAPEEEPDEDAGDIRIIRTKAHALKPMTPEEAALQMELLGHDFFVFFDGHSEQVEVVYRRRDGGYGLIEPVIG